MRFALAVLAVLALATPVWAQDMPGAPGPVPLNWVRLIVGGLLIGFFLWIIYMMVFQDWVSGASYGGEFLCDRCRYNFPRYCSKPERPNAKECSDFKLDV